MSTAPAVSQGQRTVHQLTYCSKPSGPGRAEPPNGLGQCPEVKAGERGMVSFVFFSGGQGSPSQKQVRPAVSQTVPVAFSPAVADVG